MLLFYYIFCQSVSGDVERRAIPTFIPAALAPAREQVAEWTRRARESRGARGSRGRGGSGFTVLRGLCAALNHGSPCVGQGRRQDQLLHLTTMRWTKTPPRTRSSPASMARTKSGCSHLSSHPLRDTVCRLTSSRFLRVWLGAGTPRFVNVTLY